MKVAALYDIHGNLSTLRAALAIEAAAIQITSTTYQSLPMKIFERPPLHKKRWNCWRRWRKKTDPLHIKGRLKYVFV